MIRHKGKIDRKDSNFAAYAATTFNKLPSMLKNPSLTCKQFKEALKKHTRAENKLPYHTNKVHKAQSVEEDLSSYDENCKKIAKKNV